MTPEITVDLIQRLYDSGRALRRHVVEGSPAPVIELELASCRLGEVADAIAMYGRRQADEVE